MIASISITDPMAALMISGLEVDSFGSVRTRRDNLRRRQRRFQRQARLRKQLA
jgi:heme exporter protein D